MDVFTLLLSPLKPGAPFRHLSQSLYFFVIKRTMKGQKSRVWVWEEEEKEDPLPLFSG